MALRVGELYALLKLEDREFQRGLQRAEQETKKTARSVEDLTKRLDNLGKSLKDIGDKLTTRLTLPLAGLSAYLVKVASEAEQTEEKFRVSFGEMADASLALADQLARDQQRASVVLRTMMADAQAILAPMTENREAAAQMSAALAALAVDLGSFMNISDREAFDRLISGLLGSTEATERLGISLRESVLQLEAQRLGIEGNVASMSDAEKIMLRFSAVMRQSTDAQTDAIRTGESFENQLKALRADVVTLAAELGQELLPHALALVQVGRDLVAHFRELSPEAKELGIQIAAMAAAAGPLALGLSAIVRAGAGVGRVLALIATVSRRHPLVLLASLAAVAALSIEEVRVKLNELGRAVGLGAILDQLEDLQDAFQELMDFEVRFDPESAGREALERHRQFYEQVQENVRQALLNMFQGVDQASEEAAEAAADPWQRFLDEMAKIAMDRRLARALRRLGVEAADELAVLENELALLQREIEAHLTALIELEPVAEELGEQYKQLEQNVQKLAQRFRELRGEQEALVEAQRRATEEAERQARIMEAAQRFIAIEHGDVQRVEQMVRVALGEREPDLEIQRLVVREIEQILRAFAAEGLGPGVHGFDVVREALEQEARRLRDMELDAQLRQIAQEAALARGPFLEFRQLLAAMVGEEFDPIRAEIEAVQQQILESIRVMFEAGMDPEQIRAELQKPGGLYDELFNLASQLKQDVADPIASIKERLRETLAGLPLARHVAEAAGREFDPLAFRARALEHALRDMYREVVAAGGGLSEFRDVAAQELAQLQEVTEQLRRQAILQDAVNAGLEGFTESLADGNRVVADFMRSLRWSPTGGLSVDFGNIWSTVGNIVGGMLGWLLGARPSSGPQPRTFTIPDPLRGQGLREAIRQRRELEAQLPALERAVQKAKEFVDHMAGQWWNPSQQQRARRSLEVATENLRRAQEALAAFEPREFLGYTAEDIARAVESGFNMADLSELGRNLEQIIRNALIRAWVASEEMLRLQEQFGKLLDEVITEFILHGELRAGALDPLRTVIAAIQERGEALNEVLKRLGLTSEELNREFGRMVRNIPQGYRVERAIFEAAPPRIPALAAGGIVTRPTLALIGEAGPEAVVPLGGSGFGTINITIQRMEVQDGTDFGRRLDQELRRRGLVRAGNVTAAWGGRR